MLAKRDAYLNRPDKLCSDYSQEMQIATVMSTEEEEWLNSQLNPSTIVTSETRDNTMEASEGGRTDSIQDKVANFTSKNSPSWKKNIQWVLF